MITRFYVYIRRSGEPSTSVWLSIACVHWLNRSQGRCTLQNLFVMFSQAVLNRSYKVVLIIAAVVGPWTPCGFLEGRPFYFLKRALCTKRLPAPVPNTSSVARSPLCPSFPYTSSSSSPGTDKNLGSQQWETAQQSKPTTIKSDRIVEQWTTAVKLEIKTS